MNRKIAAVLLAATMLTTPAFAASVASSPDIARSADGEPRQGHQDVERGRKQTPRSCARVAWSQGPSC